MKKGKITTYDFPSFLQVLLPLPVWVLITDSRYQHSFLLYKKLLVSYTVKKQFIIPAQLHAARARAMGIRKRTRRVRALSCSILSDRYVVSRCRCLPTFFIWIWQEYKRHTLVLCDLNIGHIHKRRLYHLCKFYKIIPFLREILIIIFRYAIIISK